MTKFGNQSVPSDDLERPRKAKVLWILLNATAMLEGSRGSLQAGKLSEDDRRQRALSTPDRAA